MLPGLFLCEGKVYMTEIVSVASCKISLSLRLSLVLYLAEKEYKLDRCRSGEVFKFFTPVAQRFSGHFPNIAFKNTPSGLWSPDLDNAVALQMGILASSYYFWSHRNGHLLSGTSEHAKFRIKCLLEEFGENLFDDWRPVAIEFAENVLKFRKRKTELIQELNSME